MDYSRIVVVKMVTVVSGCILKDYAVGFEDGLEVGLSKSRSRKTGFAFNN